MLQRNAPILLMFLPMVAMSCWSNASAQSAKGGESRSALWDGTIIVHVPTQHPSQKNATRTARDAANICNTMPAGMTSKDLSIRPVVSTKTSKSTNADTQLERYCVMQLKSERALQLDTDWVTALDQWATKQGVELAMALPTAVSLGLPPSTSLESLDAIEATRVLAGTDPAPLASMSAKKVRVIVADTEPTGPYVPTNAPHSLSIHGHSIADLIHQSLCGIGTAPAQCGAEIRYELALPLSYDSSANTTQRGPTGGVSGTLADLADAIHRATAVHLANPSTPTVLNLSLGWNAGVTNPINTQKLTRITKASERKQEVLQSQKRIKSATRFQDLDAGEKLVLSALIEARCAGVLPVAATGNRTNLPTPDAALQHGAMLPAAWQDVPGGTLVASGSVCAAMGPSQAWKPNTPLVYAVSGSDRNQKPFDANRPGAVSALNALALGAAVVREYDSGSSTTTDPVLRMSGTSVATAITSAAAAAAWAAQPNAEAPTVMDWVYQAGGPLKAAGGGNVNADLRMLSGNGVQEAHIVNICKSAKLAGQANLSCSTDTYTQGTITLDAAPATTIDLSANPPETCTLGQDSGHCGARYAASPDAESRVWPQPIPTNCPGCDIKLQVIDPSNKEVTLTVKTSAYPTPYWRESPWNVENTFINANVELVRPSGDRIIVDVSPIGLPVSSPSNKVKFLIPNVPISSANLIVTGESIAIPGLYRSFLSSVPVYNL